MSISFPGMLGAIQPLDILLGILLVLLLALGATFIQHMLFLRVPYIPTSMAVSRAMVRLAGLRNGQVVYDLGAGDGRLLTEAVKAEPGIRATGIEIVPTVWLVGWVRTRMASRAIRWKLANAMTADVSDADVIFLYVMPHMMAALEDRFDRMLKPGTVVVSNSFKFVRHKPSEEAQAAGKTMRKYVW